ncbi:MAG: copper amine oxidase N-terminal domain-containing protein [Clostridiales bacterium]|jgi:hypothetical protein|nr:copper amine oxidase N-terminal domain-containing protein [Clostridiales bacterium]
MRKKIITITAFILLMCTAAYGADALYTIRVNIGGVTVQNKGTDLTFYDGVNDIYPLRYNDVLYVPLQALSQSIGEYYSWDDDTKTAVYGMSAKSYEALEIIKDIEYYTGIETAYDENNRNTLDEGPGFVEVGDNVYFLARPYGVDTEIWAYNKGNHSAKRVLAGFKPYKIESVDGLGNVIFTEKSDVGMQHFDYRTLKFNAAENNVTVTDFVPGQVTGDMRSLIEQEKRVVYDASYVNSHTAASDILMAVGNYSYYIQDNYLYVISRAKPCENGDFVYELGRYNLNTRVYEALCYRLVDIADYHGHPNGLYPSAETGGATKELVFYDGSSLGEYNVENNVYYSPETNTLRAKPDTGWKVYE